MKIVRSQLVAERSRDFLENNILQKLRVMLHTSWMFLGEIAVVLNTAHAPSRIPSAVLSDLDFAVRRCGGKTITSRLKFLVAQILGGSSSWWSAKPASRGNAGRGVSSPLGTEQAAAVHVGC